MSYYFTPNQVCSKISPDCWQMRPAQFSVGQTVDWASSSCNNNDVFTEDLNSFLLPFKLIMVTLNNASD